MATPITYFILFSTIIIPFFLLLLPQSSADNVCPYPCYPPPTGGDGSTTPTPTTPTPPTPSTSGYFYPPPSSSGYYQPPPSGNSPYFYSPPSTYGGGGGGSNGYGVAPPPPDPVLPYFPFYYKNGLHRDQSSSPPTHQLTRLMTGLVSLASVLTTLFFF